MGAGLSKVQQESWIFQIQYFTKKSGYPFSFEKIPAFF